MKCSAFYFLYHLSFKCYVQTSLGFFRVSWKERGGRGTEGRNSDYISQVHAQRRALRIERTFTAPEYGSTSRKDAMTPFSSSSALVGNSSQGT